MKKLLSLFALLFCLANVNAQTTVTIADTAFAHWLQINIPAAMSGNQMDTTHSDVTSRKQLIIQNFDIVNLDGIQYFDSLTMLDCSNNVYDSILIQIASIPALPPMLTTLICNNNLLDSLPRLPGGLRILKCEHNNLVYLPALPNTIKLLECWENNLTHLPALPDSLTDFNCIFNQIDSLPTLPAGLITLACANNSLQQLPLLPNSITDIDCSANQLLSLPALPTALINFNCSFNQLPVLPLLPNSLVNLTCSHNQLPTLPALPNSIVFIDCSNNQITVLPTLSTALYKLNCSYNLTLPLLPALPNSLGILNCSHDQLPSLPALPNALVELHCGYNFLPVLPALPNSLVILTCGNNLLPGLPALSTALNVLECDVNQITALPALPNSLGTLNCASNPVTALPVLPGSLGSLNCNSNLLPSLPVIPGSLHTLLCNNNQLSALPALPATLGVLDCSFNNIHCFDPFHVSGYLNIHHNPFTCIPNYIPVMDSVTLLYPLCIAGNPFGCAEAAGIVGFTYKDNNSSCLKDSGDAGLKNVPLKIYNTSSNLLGTTYTAMNGVYQFLNSANTYSVMVDTVGKPFTATCNYPGLDSTVTVAVLDTNINFAIGCKSGFDVGIQSISTCGIVFPGETHRLRINAGDISKWYNLNCASGVSGTVSFTITGPVNCVGTGPGALVPTITGNVYTYSIPDFATINNQTAFQLLIEPFNTAQTGDPICVTAKVTPLSGDNNISNNDYVACYYVVNSHDPNFKEVYPVDVQPGFNDWLTYTIHFQNTGTAPAMNIMLADTLDPKLDMKTFQVIDYSHPNTTTLVGRKLTVNFSNIQLPDSTSDKEGSIGFIQYRLKSKPNWYFPYKIKNTAYIYFDFNQPVITNTTYNSIYEFATGIEDQKESLVSLYPNPSNGTFTIESGTKEKQTVQMFDITGSLVLSQTIDNGKTTIDGNYLAAGIYNISIKGNGGVINKKMVIVK